MKSPQYAGFLLGSTHRPRGEGDKGSTIRGYKGTLAYARPVIGTLALDDMGQPELRLIGQPRRGRYPFLLCAPLALRRGVTAPRSGRFESG